MTDINVNLPTLEGTITLAQQAPAAAPAAGFDATAWKTGIEQFRTTAKWVIGVFSAIGALIVAAVPFAAFSDVTPSSQAVVVWGAALALGGVAVAIAATSATLISRTVYLHEVRAKRRWVRTRTLAHTLAEHPGDVLPAGVETVADLRQAISNLDQLAHAAPAGVRESFARSLATHTEALEALLWYRRFEKARFVFRCSLVAVLVGAIATGGGVGLLLYGLDDPRQDAEVAKIEAEAAKIEAEASKLLADRSLVRAQAEQLPTDASAKYAAEVAKLEAEAAKIRAEIGSLGGGPSTIDLDRMQAEVDKLEAEIDKLEAEAEAIRADIPTTEP